MRRLVSASFALGLLAATAGTALARPCPNMTGADGRLVSVDGDVRLDWIREHLDRTARHARIWAWGWGGGIGAAGAASLAAVPFVAPQNRVDWYTGAVSAAVGVLPFAIDPPKVIRDARELNAEHGEVCVVLSDAEMRLVRSAEDQQRGLTWWFHVGNLAFNTGVTLFLGLGYGHWTAGLINGLAGLAVGEAIYFTQPTATIEDLRTYRTGALTVSYAARF
jgi:hypothetical protein